MKKPGLLLAGLVSLPVHALTDQETAGYLTGTWLSSFQNQDTTITSILSYDAQGRSQVDIRIQAIDGVRRLHTVSSYTLTNGCIAGTVKESSDTEAYPVGSVETDCLESLSARELTMRVGGGMQISAFKISDTPANTACLEGLNSTSCFRQLMVFQRGYLNAAPKSPALAPDGKLAVQSVNPAWLYRPGDKGQPVALTLIRENGLALMSVSYQAPAASLKDFVTDTLKKQADATESGMNSRHMNFERLPATAMLLPGVAGKEIRYGEICFTLHMPEGRSCVYLAGVSLADAWVKAEGFYPGDAASGQELRDMLSSLTVKAP